VSAQAKAVSPGSHVHEEAVEPLPGGSRLSCGQSVGSIKSKQKNRLGDSTVKVQ
jgi:hypothetical protein